MWKSRRTFERIGFDPADDADLRLQKRVLVAIAAMIAPAAVVWGCTYLAFDEPLAGPSRSSTPSPPPPAWRPSPSPGVTGRSA
jgi:hypothetical protein